MWSKYCPNNISFGIGRITAWMITSKQLVKETHCMIIPNNISVSLVKLACYINDLFTFESKHCYNFLWKNWYIIMWKGIGTMSAG